MSAATVQQPPAVPPRPSKVQDGPKIPPRPTKGRPDRPLSPNIDRFAQSPLNDSPFLAKGPGSTRLGPQNGHSQAQNPIDRSASVEMPSVGEEGMEYAAVAEELGSQREPSTSPEHTRTVGEDVKLHAPKPSLPAVSAKQRVATVTRTDSDRAASFGFGRPSSEEPAQSNRSLKKKASTTSQLSTSEVSHLDDEHGIPEIGIQVPMYPNAGDVQAPSPALNAGGAGTEPPKKHHTRRTSARGFESVPPGSYGLHGHGHGLLPKSKLASDYYTKHPELVKKEHHPYHDDRANDFSLPSETLNNIVRSTSRLGNHETQGTPSEQIGWQAIEESTSRLNSPRPGSGFGSTGDGQVASPRNKAFSPEISVSDTDGVIHIDDPGRRKSVSFTDLGPGSEDGEYSYQAPILAADEVAKHPTPSSYLPAVEPPPERRGSAFEMEEPHSRPSSRPASIYKENLFESKSTPLEDVQEYEPLFPDDEKSAKKEAAPPAKKDDHKHGFPSRDVWEDAPSSAHHTAEVSTPDVKEPEEEPAPEVPPRESETPAHRFAREQEALAEKEARDPVHRKKSGLPIFSDGEDLLPTKSTSREAEPGRPPMSHRFPSRDVWEDTPDSHKLECEVGGPQQEESPSETKSPQVPRRPARKTTDPSAASDKPGIPERPKPKQTPSDDHLSKPAVPERPKPQVPARPAKQLSGSDKDAEVSQPRSKPAVPARPAGGKIAALQAGFLSDLNKKLQIGPQAAKKEEVAQDLTEEKEKAPLVDARKGRARGPQRRAPRSSPSPAAAAALDVPPAEKSAAPSLSFSTTTTLYSVDPDEGVLQVSNGVLNDEKAAEGTNAAGEDAPETQTKTLASNMAGETVVEAKVTEDAEHGTVEPQTVEDVAKE